MVARGASGCLGSPRPVLTFTAEVIYYRRSSVLNPAPSDLPAEPFDFLTFRRRRRRLLKLPGNESVELVSALREAELAAGRRPGPTRRL